MKIIQKNYQDIKFEEPIAIAIGNFDGFHLGHQQIIKALLTSTLKKVLMTFNPHPRQFYQADFKVLSTDNQKGELLSQLDYLCVINFDQEFAGLGVDEFISFLQNNHVNEIYVGKDFSFGKNALGTIKDLRAYFKVVIIDDVVVDDHKVSSTLIKQLLSEGQIGEANKLLGTHYQLSSIVIHGKKLGRTLGYPTANLALDNQFLPMDGVYLVRVQIDDHQQYYGLCSIGTNPTVTGDCDKKVEVYILDFNEDIYGMRLDVEFIKLLRHQIKFNSLTELVNQLKNDEINVKDNIAKLKFEK